MLGPIACNLGKTLSVSQRLVVRILNSLCPFKFPQNDPGIDIYSILNRHLTLNIIEKFFASLLLSFWTHYLR